VKKCTVALKAFISIEPCVGVAQPPVIKLINAQIVAYLVESNDAIPVSVNLTEVKTVNVGVAVAPLIATDT